MGNREQALDNNKAVYSQRMGMGVEIKTMSRITGARKHT
jgi:hypothetical protein